MDDLREAAAALDSARDTDKEGDSASIVDARNQEPGPVAPSAEIAKLRDKILDERKNGNIVFWGLPGQLMAVKLDDFVEHPAEGMLYDLNRLEEISMTFLSDPKWVNDFAVALTIRKLVEQKDSLLTALREAQERAAEADRRAMECVEINERQAVRLADAIMVLSLTRTILAGTDIHSLPNDFPVDGMAAERMKDLLNTRRDLEAAESSLREAKREQEEAERGEGALRQENGVLIEDLKEQIAKRIAAESQLSEAQKKLEKR